MHRVCSTFLKVNNLSQRTFIRSPFSTSACFKITTDSSHYATTSSSKQQSTQQATAYAAKAESFLSGSSSIYVEDMYESWLQDSNSVHKVSNCMFNRLRVVFNPLI